MSGVKTNSKKFTTPTVAHANFSGACLAKDFGAISPNSSVMTVITIVETVGPLPPFRINENNSVLIVAEAILTMLLPINTEVKNLSKSSNITRTLLAFVLPSFAMFFKRIFDELEYAVSVAENRPENKVKITIAII